MKRFVAAAIIAGFCCTGIATKSFAAARVAFDDEGKACRVIGVNLDVTERKKMDFDLRAKQAMITHLAEHDFLTDLPNQMVLHDRVDQALKMAARNHR